MLAKMMTLLALVLLLGAPVLAVTPCGACTGDCEDCDGDCAEEEMENLFNLLEDEFDDCEGDDCPPPPEDVDYQPENDEDDAPVLSPTLHYNLLDPDSPRPLPCDHAACVDGCGC